MNLQLKPSTVEQLSFLLLLEQVISCMNMPFVYYCPFQKEQSSN